MNKKSFADQCLDLAAAATPGPWTPCLGSGNIECTALHFEGNDEHPYGLFVCDLVPDYLLDDKYENGLKFKPSNMEFITHARTDIVILAERLKRACQVLRQAGHSFIDIEGKEMEAQICRLVADELEKMPEDEK